MEDNILQCILRDFFLLLLYCPIVLEWIAPANCICPIWCLTLMMPDNGHLSQV